MPRRQTASAWAGTFREALQAVGWPGDRPLASDEYQAAMAWQEQLDSFGVQVPAPECLLARAVAVDLKADSEINVHSDGLALFFHGLLGLEETPRLETVVDHADHFSSLKRIDLSKAHSRLIRPVLIQPPRPDHLALGLHWRRLTR
jgi:hypothetical protein